VTDRRVVVTGLGVVAPLGIGRDAFWEGLASARSGVGPITRFDASSFEVRIAAEVRDFNPKEYVTQRKSLKLMKDDMKMAVAAAKLAVEDSGLDFPAVEPERVGVVIGAGMLAIDIVELARAVSVSVDNGVFDTGLFGAEGLANMVPIWLLKQLPNMSASHISIAYNALGISNTITAGAAAGAQAIGESFRIIERGGADIVLAGGTEANITPRTLIRDTMLGELSRRNDDPEGASRPFDRDRDGRVLGEGAAVLVLEERGRALRRGARIYAELAGYGSSVSMRGRRDSGGGGDDGKASSMMRALDDARCSPDVIDYISAHGDGIPEDDVMETAAIKAVFKEHARELAVSSVKSMMGDLGAAAGAVEALATILGMWHGVIPPTINLDHPGAGCDLDYVPHDAREADIRLAMSNSFSRFGQNATLIFRRMS